MTARLAWRNIWRNPTRSLVVMIAIILGIYAAMFMSGFATGMARSYVNNAIQTMVGHLQIHVPAYQEEARTAFYLPAPEDLTAFAKKQEGLAGFSLRTQIMGMAASSHGNRGVQVRGVDPEQEASVTDLDDLMVEGEFFGETRRNQILLGRKMAENLRVGLRSKVVLTFQDLSGTITAGAFRVTGIFESGNTGFDEGTVLVRQSDLNGLLVPADSLLPDSLHLPESNLIAHEFTLLLDDPGQLDTIQGAFRKEFPSLLVENYKELAPDLRLYESQIQNISIIYLAIILLALVFGIINTMLMAVLERIKELGMLMAVGMNKGKVFGMIVLETLLLTLIGAPVGILLGHLTIQYFGGVGIDLSSFSAAMQEYGLSEQLYLELEPAVYYQIPIGVFITAIVAALYPAWKAIRLRPVDAIHKI